MTRMMMNLKRLDTLKNEKTYWYCQETASDSGGFFFLSLLKARCEKSFSYTGTYNAVPYENESKLLTKLILWLDTSEH